MNFFKDLKELYDIVTQIYKKHNLDSDFAPYFKPQIRIQKNSLRIAVEDGVKSDFIIELDEMFEKSCNIYPFKIGNRTVVELVYYFTGDETNNDESNQIDRNYDAKWEIRNDI